jgi:hypothetical protein
MIDWELAHGSVHSARALCAELEAPDDELLARIEEVETKIGAEKQELEELRHFRRQRDTRAGSRSRGAMLFLLLIFGVGIPFVVLRAGLIDIYDPLTFWLVAPVTSVITCVGMVLAWYSKGPITITHTETNRKMLISVFIACTFLVLFRGAALLSGASIPVELGLELICFAALTAAMATAYDMRLLIMAPFYISGGFAILAFQSVALPIYGISHALGIAAMTAVWTRDKPSDPGK